VWQRWWRGAGVGGDGGLKIMGPLREHVLLWPLVGMMILKQRFNSR